MKLDLQMFAEGDKTISLANLQKFKEKCDETYAKIGSEYNVLDLGALTVNQTITLTDEQLALFQADNTVIKVTVEGTTGYLFKSYGDAGMFAYMMFLPSSEGINVLALHSTSSTQVQLTQDTFNYASSNDFSQIQDWAKDTTTKIPNSKLNIDSELSSTSTNAVQNKVVNEALNNTIKKTGSSEAQIIQGDISIQGDLTVSGTTITANTETLVVKDNMIVTNSDGTTLSNLSGLFIKTGTSSGYAIVYDPSSNSVILGEGTIDSSNEVTVVASERKAIATRMDSQAIKNDNVLVWDDALKVLKDGGFSKTIVDSKYVKPSGGIPKTDLASVVQSSLNKADSALQSVPDASTTVKGIALLGASGGSARYGQKADVGLGNVVNTADSATPTQNGTTKFTTGGAYAMQSTLQTAINSKQNALNSTQQNAINSGITQEKVTKYDGYENTINSKANASEVVKKSGDTMTGDITFQSIGVGESSKGLKWDGATDGASIKYVVDGDDAGRLVIESTDDSNARIIIRNNNQGTLHDTVFEDGTVTIDEKLVITNKSTDDRELIKLADDIDLVDYQDCRLGVRCNTANDFGIHFKGSAGRDATYMFPSSGGTLAINTSNGFNPDNFNDSSTWLNHTSSENQVGNSNRPLVLYGTQIKNNSGQIIATEDYVNDNMPKSALVWRGHSTNVTGLSLDTNSFYMIQLYCDVPQAVKTIIVKPSVIGISGLIGFSYNNYRFYGNTFHLSLNTSICSISSNNGNGFGINSSGNGVVGLSGLPVYITFIYKIL